MSATSWQAGMVAAVLAAVQSAAPGQSLIELAPSTTDTHGIYTASEGRAISPDGRFVVGLESKVGGSFSQKGVLWNALTGELVGDTGQSPASYPGWVLSSDNAGAEFCTGIGYRMVDGQEQLVIHGRSAGGWSTTWFSSDGGQSYLPKIRPVVTGTIHQFGNNSVGAGGVDDTWYQAWFLNPAGGDDTLNIGAGSGNPASMLIGAKNTPDVNEAAVRGVSGTGRGAGFRKDNSGNRQTYIVEYNGPTTLINYFVQGLAGNNLGEGFGVSLDGTKVVGTSPVTGGRPGNWPYIITNPGAGQTINELPTYPDTAGSVTNGVAYHVSASGTYACGMNYRGLEKAVLWNLSDPDPANWTIIDLTEYFNAAGQLGNFTRLSRAYSVGVDGNGNAWVTGIGNTAAGTRGFSALVPSGPGQAIGACCISSFGSRTCSLSFEEDCTEGVFTANTSCAVACPPCGTPFADVDFDGDVDQTDFALLQRCTTGVSPGGVPEGCACLDRVVTDPPRIDGDDIAEFMGCVSGPDVPWTPSAGCNP